VRHYQPFGAMDRHAPMVSAAVACLMAAGLTACTATPTASTATPPPATAPPSPGTTGPPVPTPATALIVEPDQGMPPIYTSLGSPTRTLDLSMYELVDTRAESILATDAGRGVEVRVLLDHGLEASQNQPAYSYLSTHGVQVRWAPTKFRAFHIKTFCIDSSLCTVMTLNLASRDDADTRDLAVTDSNPADVAAMEATFTADFDGAPTTPPAGTDLIWSPGSSPPLTSLIGSATSELLIYNEEMSDPTIVAALAAAARRRVVVKVVMTDQSWWSPEFSTLTAAGVQVRVFHGETPIYIHAKMIVADRKEAFVGSENFSRTSLDANRELGVVVTDPAMVAAAGATFATDFAGALPWPPDRMAVSSRSHSRLRRPDQLLADRPEAAGGCLVLGGGGRLAGLALHEILAGDAGDIVRRGQVHRRPGPLLRGEDERFDHLQPEGQQPPGIAVASVTGGNRAGVDRVGRHPLARQTAGQLGGEKDVGQLRTAVDLHAPVALA